MRNIAIVAFALIWSGIPAGAQNTVPRPLKLKGGSLTTTGVNPLLPPATTTYEVNRAPHGFAPQQEGAWARIPAMTLGAKEQVRGKWDGSKDLSGSLRLLWDGRGLYFHLEVTDDRHVATNAKSDWWMNDASQFALDAYLNGPGGGYDDDEHSYLVGGSPQGPILASYRRPGAGGERESLVVGQKPAMKLRADGVRVFDWFMSWRDLRPLSPWLWGRCGFSWTLNDNDGNGFETAATWTPGIMYGQDAAKFGQLIFKGAASLRPAVLGLRPEFKITGRETTSKWLEVPGGSPFGRARMLLSVPSERTVTAGVKVFRAGTAGIVAEGTTRVRLKARQATVLWWDVSRLPNGRYEVEYTAPGVQSELPLRLPYYQINVDRLRSLRTSLARQFALDRPWDDMVPAPDAIKRHRGMVAVALQLLDRGDWTKPAGAEPGEDYVEMLGQVANMVEALKAGQDFLGKQRGAFYAAYYSRADGSGQPFVTMLPADYHPAKRYPLILHLHGAGGVPMLSSSGVRGGMEYIEVLPWGRGARSGFAALGEDDVLQVIAYMKRWYKIDADRIYITGASMGGRGGWRMTSRHPHIFAATAPVCGYAMGLPLENLRHVPVFAQHGDMDWSVPVDASRYGVSRLQQLGYSVLYRELPGSPHSPTGLFPERPWLLNLRRPTKPGGVTFTCQTPRQGQAYWLQVEEMVNPHSKAVVSAAFCGTGNTRTLMVVTGNILEISFDVCRMPVNCSRRLLVQINRQFIEIPAPLPSRLYLHQSDGKWQAGKASRLPSTIMRPYRAGAAANLYTGREPVLVVYGTTGSPEQTALLKKTADLVAQWAGAGRDLMPLGKFPAKADRDVTASDLQRFNLIVLGRSSENKLAARIAPRLPLEITPDSMLNLVGHKPVALDAAVMSLHHYNPLSPQRLIYWVAAPDCDKPTEESLAQPYQYIFGTTDDMAIDEPDLVVRALDGTTRLSKQFTHGWKWREVPGHDRPVPAALASRPGIVTRRLELMRQVTGADFALDYADSAPLVDPRWCSISDLAGLLPATETLTASLTRAELMEIYERWINKGEMVCSPPISAESLHKDRTYRVVVTPDLTWMLIQRQKNLNEVEAGPEITSAALFNFINERISG